jgi:hypothetical protein
VGSAPRRCAARGRVGSPARRSRLAGVGSPPHCCRLPAWGCACSRRGRDAATRGAGQSAAARGECADECGGADGRSAGVRRPEGGGAARVTDAVPAWVTACRGVGDSHEGLLNNQGKPA